MDYLPTIMVAPNGARRTKADHPALPMSVSELAATAAACMAAGADAIHLHVRDDDGRHSLDVGRYRDAMAAVGEAAPDMAIQITTESAGRYDVAEQYALLDSLRPAWASLSVREMARDPAIAIRTYLCAKEAGIRIQHILYSPSCVDQLQCWVSEGVISEAHTDVLFVLGKYAQSGESRPLEIEPLQTLAAENQWSWTICAFGRYEHDCLVEALRRGGRARVGFENNLYASDGTLLPDNSTSVAMLQAAYRDK